MITTAMCALAGISTVAALSGCGGSNADADARPAVTAQLSTAAMSQLAIENAWVKTADSGMTAVFGEIRNTSSSSVIVISATTSASPEAGLHEMAMVGGTKQMRPKKGGFVIPAGTTHLLAPGGDHIMVMGITRPIRPGDKVDVTLNLAGGSTAVFAALGKASSAGQETYAPGQSPTPSSMPAK